MLNIYARATIANLTTYVVYSPSCPGILISCLVLCVHMELSRAMQTTVASSVFMDISLSGKDSGPESYIKARQGLAS